VGPEALSPEQRWVLEGAGLVKEGVLQQSALDPVDSYCSPEKQYALMDMVLAIYHQGRDLLRLGVPIEQIATLPIMGKVRRLKSAFRSDELDVIKRFHDEIRATFDPIRMEYSAARGKQP
jgi:V/A-type H+-transporting ATPase subunit A